MSDTNLFDLLQKRRAELEQKRAKILRDLDDLNREQARLEQEAREIEITHKVLKSLSQPNNASNSLTYFPPASKTGRKPEGTPTIAAMIDDALAVNELLGPEIELDTQGIVQHIRSKWWPDAQNSDIAPLLWRLSKQGRVAKVGNKYARIKLDRGPEDVKAPENELGES